MGDRWSVEANVCSWLDFKVKYPLLKRLLERMLSSGNIYGRQRYWEMITICSIWTQIKNTVNMASTFLESTRRVQKRTPRDLYRKWALSFLPRRHSPLPVLSAPNFLSLYVMDDLTWAFGLENIVFSPWAALKEQDSCRHLSVVSSWARNSALYLHLFALQPKFFSNEDQPYVILPVKLVECCIYNIILTWWQPSNVENSTQ